jgi:hypothetical protein
MATKTLSGGDELKAKLAEIAHRVGKAGMLRVGFLEGSTEADGTSIPMIAAVQEYGAPSRGIPPRPYFRPMIATKSPSWGGALADILKANDYDVTTALGLVGEDIAGDLRQSIIDLTSPPLSPVTLMTRQIVGPNGRPTFADVQEARRRVAEGERAQGVATKPLVWTGTLLGSVSYDVKSANEV